MLEDKELLRYSRQILLAEVDVLGQQKIKESRVLVIGLGGLGSPAALYLAAAGVGTLYLADFDTIDISNLQRQVIFDTDQLKDSKVKVARERLAKLNPDIIIHSLADAINEENIQQIIEPVDIVLDCTDNFLTRDLINQACFRLKKKLVSGAAIQLQGQLTTFNFTNGQGPCYQCLYGDSSADELTCNEVGVLGPVVAVIGLLQVLEVIKLVVGFGEPLIGRLLTFNGLNNRFRDLRITQDPFCLVCGDSDE